MSFTLSNVHFAYPGAEAPALRGVDLSIPSGGTTSVLGVSGAGKSTLLYLLGLLWDGRLAPGRIAYQDHDYDTLDSSQQARLRREEFGFALQSCYLLPFFSCAQNILMPLALDGRNADDLMGRVEDLVDRLDDAHKKLRGDMHKPAGAVSGGQKQRFSVIRAIVHDPQVVFADEPFSSLDTSNTRQILGLLQSWRDGQLKHSKAGAPPRSLIMVCHDLHVAYDWSDRFVFVGRDGRVVEDRVFEKAEIHGADELRRRIEGGHQP